MKLVAKLLAVCLVVLTGAVAGCGRSSLEPLNVIGNEGDASTDGLSDVVTDGPTEGGPPPHHCKSNMDCDSTPSTPYCEIPPGKCVACEVPSQCPAGDTCIDFQCVPLCTGGSCVGDLSCCVDDGQSICVDEQTDPNNCGTCGMICTYDLCQSGACAVSIWGAGDPSPGTGTPLSVGGDALIGDRVACGKSTDLVAIGAYTIDGGIKMRLGLFTDSPGEPGTLVAQTAELTSVANGRTEGAITPTSILSGDYWVMILSSANIHVATETVMVTWYYESPVTYGPIPASFTSSGSLTTNYGDLYYVTTP
jgi:hypothetical protein